MKYAAISFYVNLWWDFCCVMFFLVVSETCLCTNCTDKILNLYVIIFRQQSTWRILPAWQSTCVHLSCLRGNVGSFRRSDLQQYTVSVYLWTVLARLYLVIWHSDVSCLSCCSMLPKCLLWLDTEGWYALFVASMMFWVYVRANAPGVCFRMSLLQLWRLFIYIFTLKQSTLGTGLIISRSTDGIRSLYANV